MRDLGGAGRRGGVAAAAAADIGADGGGAIVVHPLPSCAGVEAGAAAATILLPPMGRLSMALMRSDQSLLSRFEVGAHINTAMCRIDRCPSASSLATVSTRLGGAFSRNRN